VIGRLVGGALISTVVSLAGWKLNALSGRGAIAATGVGSGIAAGSSWRGLTLLAIFFVTSSALSRQRRRDAIAAKGSRRDERQVLANGAVAAVAALATRGSAPPAALALVGGPLAAAASDTWATEIGSSSGPAPRLAWSGRAVPSGTSGGVTLRGSLASLAGAAMIGGATGLLTAVGGDWRRGMRAAAGTTVAGLAGSLTDSLLGELVQERRRCPECDAVTESLVHRCGAETVHAGGLRGFDNDAVNLVCTTVGWLAAIPFAREWD
jgi:uncharacterized protein (TIGR00297 family)